MLAKKLQEVAGNGADAKLYVDDVFSAFTYTGNDATQTINNGIDLAGKGGMVWTKTRQVSGDNMLVDSAWSLSGNKYISTNLTVSPFTGPTITAFNNTGFTLSPNWYANTNGSAYASWTFRKAPKFFDVVTYTGNGVAGRQIAHSLGVAPGMIMIKATSAAANWAVYHRSTGNASYLVLNATQEARAGLWNSTTPTNSVFTLGADAYTNDAGTTYVAYIFAHDTSADGIVQCGTFTGNTTVTLGWEPQYLLAKRVDSAGSWYIIDTSRQFDVGSAYDYLLYAESSGPENTTGANVANPISTGFESKGFSAAPFIYMAIRRSNKPPTTGTQVYNAIARTGTGAAATVTGVGFAPDSVLIRSRTYQDTGSWDSSHLFFDRLRGAGWRLGTAVNNAEDTTNSFISSMDMQGVSLPAIGYTATNNAGTNYINHFFKRAPGFFDEVCWTGTGESIAVNHNLTVPPELYIEKCRSTSEDWYVTLFSPNTFAHLNLTTKFNYLGIPLPTSTQFTTINGTSGRTNVSYLFATLAGISKVGSYTGNGGTQNIECGFAAGARFVLVKRTDSAGDWYVWDTARGIVSANDPHLSLNTTSAEVTTDDSVDPYSAGFAVNQVAATNINVASATYIFLAIS